MTTIKHILISGILAIVILASNTQTADAQRRNATPISQTTYDLIKARTEILEHFKNNEMAQVRALRDTVRSKYETENTLAFFPAEYWLLCFATNDYALIIKDKFLSDTSVYNNTYASYPIFDIMGEEVRKIMRQKVYEISKSIQSSSESQTNKDLLTIILNYSVHLTNEVKDTLQLTINDLSKKYLENPQNKIGRDVIQRFIIKEYKGSGYADEISFGGGIAFPNGNIADYLASGYTISLDYKRYFGNSFIGFDGQIYSGTMIDSIDVDGKNLKKDELFNIYKLGLTAGNKFIETRKIATSIIVGGGYNAFNETHESKSTDNITTVDQIVINSYYVKAGLSFDYKFIKQGNFAEFKKFSDFNHYKFLRLKYEYQMMFLDSESKGLKGGVHSISLSIGFNTQSIIKK